MSLNSPPAYGVVHGFVAFITSRALSDVPFLTAGCAPGYIKQRVNSGVRVGTQFAHYSGKP